MHCRDHGTLSLLQTGKPTGVVSPAKQASQQNADAKEERPDLGGDEADFEWDQRLETAVTWLTPVFEFTVLRRYLF